ncbi:response regulator [Sediminibacter sp. Hel_I_10]|uniref:response regulator n=1 Tax=Sediminibacter sp. Hel_I_10 TaxID=1392490 RepID=UPI00047A3EE6|nr:response regulator [Sediminibacter sp. Hel_I_10]
MSKVDLTCIIDDDPVFIFAAKRVLNISEFCKNFTVFNNGQEAIQALKPIIQSGKEVPDVILLDLNMPIMDGWQFLDEFIKIKSPKKLLLYIVSSSIDPADLKKAKSYELVSDYIIKPITKKSVEVITRSFD